MRPKDPQDWRWRFLQHIANGDAKAVAAAKCGKSRQTVQNHLEKHPNFKRKYNQAVQSFVDQVETNLNTIAKTSGHLYNFPAMMAILKARRAGVYNPKPKPEGEGIGTESVAMILARLLPQEKLGEALEEIRQLVDEQRKKNK